MPSDALAAHSTDVLVIGGGFAGLLAARRAAQAGLTVTVLEATEHLGGRVAAVTLDGLALDAGAESFATRGGTVEALCAELGVSDDVVEPNAKPAWVVGPNAAYPLPATSWLGIPARPLSPDVRRVVGWGGAVRAATDLVRPARSVRRTTLGDIARDRLGVRTTQRLVAPVVTGVYTRDIDALPIEDLAPGLRAEVATRGLIRAARARREAQAPGAAVRSLRGGLHRLVDALAADAAAKGVRIETGAAVTSLARDGETWVVRTATQAVTAPRVVLAIPAHAVATLWGDHDGGATPHGRVAIETLVVDAPALDRAPRGTGVLAQPGVTPAKALTHSSAKWQWLAELLPAGRHVVRLSYTLDPAGTPASRDAVSDASALLGVALDPAAVVASASHVWPDAAPSAPPVDLPAGCIAVGSAAGLTGLAAITHHVTGLDFV